MNDAETAETFSFGLGHEELLVILRVLKARTILGLKDDPMEDYTEEQAAVAMGTAERSLRAQGLLNILEDQGTVEVEPVLMSTIGTCAYPQTSIAVVLFVNEDSVVPRFYHKRDKLLVEHVTAGDGIHEFTIAEQQDAIWGRLLEFLSLSEKPAMSDTRYEASLDMLEELRGLIQKGSTDVAIDKLAEKGFDRESAESYVEMLQNADRNYLIVRSDYSEDFEISTVENLFILDGEKGTWLISSNDSTGDTAVVENVSTAEAVARVKELLAKEREV